MTARRAIPVAALGLAAITACSRTGAGWTTADTGPGPGDGDGDGDGAPGEPRFAIAPPHDKIVGIGRARAFACAVHASGGVDCWGRAGVGRPEPRPRRIPGVTDAVAITPDGSCVLRATGEVACMAGDRIELVPVAGVANVAALGTGDPGCFIERAGSVICADPPGAPQRLPDLTDAVAVSRAYGVACAVRRSGQVACSKLSYGDPPGPPRPLTELGAVRRFVLARGTTSPGGCAILTSGALRCFALDEGDDGGWSIADSDRYERATIRFDAKPFAGVTELAIEDSGAPFSAQEPFVVDAIVGGKVVHWDRHGTVTVPTLTDAAQLAPGCAVRAQGSVVCWGSNDGGALGQPTTIGRMLRPPTPVVGAADVVALALGASDSWALTRKGRVLHWGRSGTPRAEEVAVPYQSGAITTLVALDSGPACVLGATGSVWCWIAGADMFERQIESGVVAISGEHYSMLAVRADGTAIRMQLGSIDPSWPIHQPAGPPPPDTVALAGGEFRSCATSRAGTVTCGDRWTAVPDLVHPDQVLAEWLTCARVGGTVRCYQHDFETDAPTRYDAPEVADATDLALSSDTLCAVRTAGHVTCWGRHFTDEADPIPVGAIDVELGSESSDPGSSSVVQGRDYGCAIMVDHTVQCWGSNLFGELGDGSIAESSAPLGVPGL